MTIKTHYRKNEDGSFTALFNTMIMPSKQYAKRKKRLQLAKKSRQINRKNK